CEETRRERNTAGFAGGLAGLGQFISETVGNALESLEDIDVDVDVSFGGRGNKRTMNYVSNMVTTDIPSIKLMGKNAPVEIKGYDGDCVKMYIRYNPKRGDANIVVSEEGGGFELLYDYNSVRWLAIECHVPNVFIGNIHGENKNSKVQLESVTADRVTLISSNSAIKMKNITCPNIVGRTKNSAIYAKNIATTDIDLQTSNSKIDVEHIKAKTARLTTSNSNVKTEDVDIEQLYIKTSNGGVKVENVFPEGFEVRGTVVTPTTNNGHPLYASHTSAVAERSVDVHTSNGNISVNVPRDVAMKLQASTSNAKIDFNRHNMIVEEMSKNYYNGKSSDYDGSYKKAKLKLNTSNATVKVKEV
ncbi:MAG: DUF4097 domain-containing protein, partial [Defluviitaleaceae bacterium]|nr:DUF4097 domain-containing protein [Defluviitaleaceae bacterium]